MANCEYTITYKQFGGATTYNITQAVEISTHEGVEAKTDTFAFKVLRKNLPSGAENIDIEDEIKIYLGGGPIPENLVMDGVVKEVRYDISTQGRYYTIKGTNRLEALLTNPMPATFSSTDTVAPDGTGWRAGDIIKYYIDLVNEYQALRENWVNIGTSQISTTTKHIDYYSEFKPVFQHLEELSTNDYTGNGQYVMYLDTNNDLVWKPRPSTTTGTIREGDVLKMRIDKRTYETTNYLVINCGNDLNGHRISTYAVNLDSVGKIGIKGKYVAKPEIARNIIATNPSADNDTIRNKARDEGKRWGDMVVKLLGAPRYKVQVDVRGGIYTKGDLWTIAPDNYTFSNGASTYDLRLVEVTHTFNARQGWVTTLSFEEDEDTALANI